MAQMQEIKKTEVNKKAKTAYTADETNYSIYTAWQQKLNSFSWYLGLRAEYNTMRLNSYTTDATNPPMIDDKVNYENPMLFFSPSLAVGYDINEKMKIKFNFGRTYDKPQFREIAPYAFYDYEAKYTKGLTDLICPARLSMAETCAAQEMAILAHRTLGCRGISRTDMHLDTNGQLWFHEVNSCPGMTETSDVPHEALAAGMTYDELVLEILQSALYTR